MKQNLHSLPLGQRLQRIFFLGLLTGIGASILAPTAQAQVSAYSFNQNTAAVYVPLTTGTVLGSIVTDEEQFNNPAVPGGTATAAAGPGLPIGFAFDYNGATYDRFAVNANGWLALGNSSAGATAVTAYFSGNSTTNYIPLSTSTNPPNNALAPFARDLQAQAGAELRYDLLGTAPNRTLVVQWTNYRLYLTANVSLNFQVRLHETSQAVDFAYGTMTTAATTTNAVQVGLRGSSAADFTARTNGVVSPATWTTTAPANGNNGTVPFSGVAAPPTGLVYTFAPPVAGACLPPIGLTIGSITPAGAALSFTAPAGATSFGVTVTPAGGVPTTVTPAPAASPVALSGLQANTAYTVSVVNNCAGGVTSAAASVSFTTPLAAPTNDDCTGATALTVTATCTNVPVNTVGATAGGPVATCGAPAGPDVWFTAVVPGSGDLTVTTSSLVGSLTTDTVLELYTGTCTNLTSIGCNDDANAGTGFSSVTASGLAPGAVVHVRAWVFGSTSTGTFNICAFGSNTPTCAAATNLTIGSLTTTSASLSFTGPVGVSSYTVTVTPQGGLPTTVTPNPTASPVALSNLTAGTTYTVRVTTTCLNGASGTAASVTFTVPNGNTPTNDDCTAAIALPVANICTNRVVSTLGATASGPTVPASGCGGGGPDVWYAVVVPATGTVTVTTSALAGFGSFDTVLEIYSGTCTGLVSVGCNDDFNGTPFSQVVLTGQTPGARLLVRASGFGAATGQFNICATAANVVPPSCAAPFNLQVSGITQTGATITFTAPTPAPTDYTVTLTPQNGGPTITVAPNPTASPVTVAGLSGGTNYTVRVNANCANGGVSVAAQQFFVTPAGPPPPNDECAGAIALTASTTCVNTPVNLSSATPSGGPVRGCGAQNSGDVWYSVTVPASGSVNATTSAGATGNADTVLELYSGTCAGGMVSLGCNDDITGVGTFSSVTANGRVPGSIVFVRVSLFGNNPGNASFNICVTDPPPCLPPTALTVSNITYNSASLNFTPSATGVSYTATLTTATGQMITRFGTFSPINVFNLAANTTYTVSLVSTCGPGNNSAPVTTTFTTPPAPPCNPPTNVTVSNLAFNSATLNFTPAAAGISYTAALTTPNGPAGTRFGTFSPILLNALLANTTYTVSLVSNCGNGNLSAPIVVTFTTPVAPPCNPPTNLTVSNILYNAATVNFTPVAGFTYTATFTASNGQVRTGFGNTSPINVVGLLASTTYTVSLVSNCAPGNVSLPVTTTFTTPATPPCLAPTGVVVNSISTNGGLLNFTPAAAATGYNVTVSDAGGVVLTRFITTSPFLITNLLPGILYTVAVTSNCAGIGSSPVVTTTFTTLTATGGCPGPTALTVNSLVPGTATVSFVPGAGNVSYSVLYYPTNNPSAVQGISPNPTASPVQLTGLASNLNYTVLVAASCGAGVANTISTTFFSVPGVANDNPLGAVPLNVGPMCVRAFSSNFNATTTVPNGYPNPAPGCGTATSPRDVWFSFQTLASGLGSQAVRLDVTGNPAGLVRVFAAPSALGPFAPLACGAGTGPNTPASPVSVYNLTPATRYYVSVAGYADTDPTGNFTICATGILNLAARPALAGSPMQVFPNPAHHAATLRLPALGAVPTATVELLNGLGQLVGQQAVPLRPGGTETQLDLTGLSAGLYVVRVRAGRDTAVLRLAVE